jgi:anti-anti-sigma factor
VSFLDSSGLRLLLRLHKDLGDAGRRLVVVQGPRRVARVFELTGAEAQLEIVEDPAQIS